MQLYHVFKDTKFQDKVYVFQTQITTLCVATSMNATVALVCLYSPKVYIIVLHPDKNVRKLTMNSAAYKKYNSGPASTYTASSTHKGWSNCKLAKSILLRPTYFDRSFVRRQYFLAELLQFVQSESTLLAAQATRFDT